MKKTLLFLFISIAIHSLLLFITIKPPKSSEGGAVPIEIISKKEDLEIAPGKEPVIPPEGIREEDIPNELSDPNTLDTVPKKAGTETEDKSDRPPITPKIYKGDKPPKPMDLADILKEQILMDELGDMGPSRRIDDIVRENLNPQYQEGEDGVSFNHMSQKYNSYFYNFARELYYVWKYPVKAAQRGESGIVRVTFDIMKDGRLTNIKMLESSGYPELDREVMRTLNTMKGVPLPDGLEIELLHINGYFIYSLTGDYRLY